MVNSNNGFTFPRRYGVILLLLALALISGCGASGTIDGNTPGFFNHYVVYPFSAVLERLAAWTDGNYGFAIIALTLLVRIALLPIMLRQQIGQLATREKMNKLAPELKEIQEKYKSKKDPDSVRQMQQETMQLYRKHSVNPLAIGCLPMLIQLPIWTGLYYAIRMTPELTSHSFLWFKLGASDPVMPLVAAAIYLVQSVLSQKLASTSASADNAVQKQMAALVYLSPIMMGIFSFTAPAALPLYWAVGGVFMIGQTLLAHQLHKRRVSRDALATAEADVGAGAKG